MNWSYHSDWQQDRKNTDSVLLKLGIHFLPGKNNYKNKLEDI